MEDFEKRDHQPSLEEENKRQQKYWKKNYIWTIAVLVVVLIIGLFRSSGPVLTPGETQLTVQQEGYAIAVDYADVISLALLHDCSYGSCIDGTGEGRYYYGRWENAAWGEYDLCVDSKVDCCLVIGTASGTTVLNYNSEKETEQLYELLRQSCEHIA